MKSRYFKRYDGVLSGMERENSGVWPHDGLSRGFADSDAQPDVELPSDRIANFSKRQANHHCGICPDYFNFSHVAHFNDAGMNIEVESGKTSNQLEEFGKSRDVIERDGQDSLFSAHKMSFLNSSDESVGGFAKNSKLQGTLGKAMGFF